MRRNADDKLHLTLLQQVERLRLARRRAGNAEAFGVGERFQDAAYEGSLIRKDDGGRHVFRIGVDGEAEKGELHQRHADHHGEGQAVSAHLDEFLDEYGAEPGEGSAHCMLSRALAMRWMNTSSRFGFDRVQVKPGSLRWAATASSRAVGSEPLTCSVWPKGATISIPG